MGDVIEFPSKARRARKRSTGGNRTSVSHPGSTLCRRGLHRWVIDSEQRFDVKQGRLVTVYRCTRCGKRKSELS